MDEPIVDNEHMDRSSPRLDRSNDITLDIDHDDIDTLRKKIDLAEASASLKERREIFVSRMLGFKVVFFPIVGVMFVLSLWSVYTLYMSAAPTPSQVDTSKFIISTVVSAAIATLIGFLATHPSR
jgi:hypothetical protein